MSAATETTQTGSLSSPTGRRTGEWECLLSLTWFHHKRVSAYRALFFPFISEESTVKVFGSRAVFKESIDPLHSCGTRYASQHV